MNPFLAQVRRGTTAIIAENPTTIIISRHPLVDDGFGGTVPDPFGTTTESVLKVRISHEKQGPFKLESTDAGLSTGLGRFILTQYNADIQEGDTFEALGKTWRVGPVDSLVKFGGTHAKQAPLIEQSVSPIEEEEET